MKKPNTSKGDYFAKTLIKAGGFRYCVNPPFMSVSGLKEPFYHDHRMLMAYPKYMNKVANSMVSLIRKYYKLPKVVVAVATGAIPYATLVAKKLKLPLAYVRVSQKDHGTKKTLEGVVNKNDEVIIIEDVMVLGVSTMRAYSVLKENKAKILGVISIYNLKLDRLKLNLDNIHLKYMSLYDLDVLLKVSKKEKYFTKEQFDLISNWRKNPYDFFGKTHLIYK